MNHFYPLFLASIRFLYLVAGLCLLGSVAGPAVQAQTLYVSPTGSNTNPATATTWATSTSDLQGAISAAQAGGQVWVATGTYKPTIIPGNAIGTTNRSFSFDMKNGVAIYGGFPGTGNPGLGARNPTSYTTVLSGEIGDPTSTTDNCYHVVNNKSVLLNNTAILDGFIITGGNANDTNFPNNSGGGILNYQSGPSVANCVFQRNSAAYGGAMYNTYFSPTLTSCSFQSNSATVSAGAMYNAQSNPTLTACSFSANSAGALGRGGAIYNDQSDPSLINSSFQGNVNGAVYNSTSSPTLLNCSFQGNSGAAAVLNQFTSSPTLLNCSFQSNSGATSNGTGCSQTLTNCSFQGNGTVVVNSGSSTLTNCVVFGNGFTNLGGTISVTYSLLENTVTGYTSDPTNLTTTTTPFASTTATSLAPCAPAINAGSNAAYNAFFNPPTTDLAGNPRFYNNGSIDMGAYEFQGLPLSVSVSANPSFTITTGQSTTLIASAGASYPSTSYVWSTSQTGSNISVSPIATTVYSVTGTTGVCSVVASATVVPVCFSVVYVTPTGAGLQNGSSWANAYPGTSLQTAIDLAAVCSAQVWVTTGTYKPTGSDDRTISFAMKNGVAIYGGFAGTETTLSQRPISRPSRKSILSGDIDNDNTLANNSYHVISNPAGLTATAILDGFIITGGNADDTNYPNNSGGGLLNGQSSPSISNCIFQNNYSASFGGAISHNSDYNLTIKLTLTNCLFQNNSSTNGGAMLAGGNPVILNCQFQNNSATNQGGAIYNGGNAAVTNGYFKTIQPLRVARSSRVASPY